MHLTGALLLGLLGFAAAVIRVKLGLLAGCLC